MRPRPVPSGPSAYHLNAADVPCSTAARSRVDRYRRERRFVQDFANMQSTNDDGHVNGSSSGNGKFAAMSR